MEVGLGYVRLGQPATTLSGGEAQRVKLASELQKRSTGRTVYVLDEPTTGLHFEDIRKLLGVLSSLVDKGNTVLVIEHNLDVIKTADWIVDMGPAGGNRGGTVVATGTPEQVAAHEESFTGEFLRPLLEGLRGPRNHLAARGRKTNGQQRSSGTAPASVNGTSRSASSWRFQCRTTQHHPGPGIASRRAVMGGFVGLGIGVPLCRRVRLADDEGGPGAPAAPRPGTVGRPPTCRSAAARSTRPTRSWSPSRAEGDFKAFSTICTHQAVRRHRDQGRGHRLHLPRQPVLDH